MFHILAQCHTVMSYWHLTGMSSLILLLTPETITSQNVCFIMSVWILSQIQLVKLKHRSVMVFTVIDNQNFHSVRRTVSLYPC